MAGSDVTAVAFFRERLSRDVGQISGVLRDGVQFAVRHGGVEFGETLAFLRGIGSGHATQYTGGDANVAQRAGKLSGATIRLSCAANGLPIM